jgi:hypothetical protein
VAGMVKTCALQTLLEPFPSLGIEHKVNGLMIGCHIRWQGRNVDTVNDDREQPLT